ncbi:MAG: hypothetical protein ABL860_07840, partial [Candidatus Nitrotoga sp.]
MKITFLLPHLKPAGGVFAPFMFAHHLSKRGHHVTIAVESKVWTRYVRNLFHSRTHPLLPRDSAVRIKRVKDFSELPDGDAFISASWVSAKKLQNLKISAKKFDYVQHDERLYHGDPKLVEETYRYPIIRIPNATWLQRMFKTEFHEDTTLLINAVDCEQFHPNKRTRSPDDGVTKVLVLHHDYEWKGTKEGVE